MPHSQDDLAPDAEVIVEQQVVGLVDRAGRRVLHRQRAIVGRPRLYGFKNVLEAVTR